MTDTTAPAPSLTAVALVCSLKPSPAQSSTQLLAEQLLTELASHGVTTSSVRVVDYDVRPGVLDDMGDGDQWPELRRRVLDADILVMATPTWVGHMSSVAHRVLERLDNELSVTDDQGRPGLYDRVAVAAIVGNEDGAHQITAELFQALNDLGFTVPAQGATYWNGEAMQAVDYKDLESTPEKVASATKAVAANAVHVARLLREHPLPASS
ncbi:flavodoxin family protein [Microbacteriaceae bacterium 4G12]